MRHRVPKALNLPLLFFGLPADDLAVSSVFVMMLIVCLSCAGVRSFLVGYGCPFIVGGGMAAMLKKINDLRPTGYTRHIAHKWGVWNNKMKKNHLMPPGKRLYSP